MSPRSHLTPQRLGWLSAIAVLAVLGGALAWADVAAPAPSPLPAPAAGVSAPMAPPFPPPGANVSGTTWINSQPLSMRKLRGKVVMIDFWEYTCINCIRTFPENKTWWRRYRKYGFVIIGVHDPEFKYAHDVANVRAAVRRFGLPYPIVVDDWYRIWNAYHSDVWPNRFLIDAQGRIRFHLEGEGHNREFEQAIQFLLQEAHPGLKFPASYALPPAKNAWGPGCGQTTPEMYVGNWFGRGVLANPFGYHDGKTHLYRLPREVADGSVVLAGKWRSNRNGMMYAGRRGEPSAAGQLEMRYHARQMYAVLNVVHGRPERLYILQDGKPLTARNKGVDVRFDRQGRSYIEVAATRMYYLVQNPALGAHRVQLQPTAPGVMVDSFTFGNNCQTDFPHD
jgi:peroxiredoxin